MTYKRDVRTLVLGMTGSGKTCVGKAAARAARARGVYVMVFDPMRDPEWNGCADKVTDSIDELLRWADDSLRCFIVVDEASLAVDRWAGEERFTLATRSRHRGHTVWFLGQHYAQISPIVRGQCETAYLFRLGSRAQAIAAEEWACPQLQRDSMLTGLADFEYVRVDRFGKAEKRRFSPPWEVACT